MSFVEDFTDMQAGIAVFGLLLLAVVVVMQRRRRLNQRRIRLPKPA
jgi:MYXO-CTERM domain-containing protein